MSMTWSGCVVMEDLGLLDSFGYLLISVAASYYETKYTKIPSFSGVFS